MDKRVRSPIFRGEPDTLLGVGLYTVAEASRLTGVSRSRIKRWLTGYSYEQRGRIRHSDALWSPQVPQIRGRFGLGFLDLIEVQFINSLRERGATWKTIRSAAQTAKEEYQHSHPFATRRFLIRTDGQNILGYVLAGPKKQVLMDLASKEFVLEKLIAQSFIESIDFDQRQATRWWPMGRKRGVVIDPKRSFGQPVVIERGIPTLVLADAYQAEGNYKSVAKWFDVTNKSVRDSVEFERRLAA